jgi:hypothetical protein
MDDLAFLGVDDREEVGRTHAGALVQAREVEELLGLGPLGFLGRGVKGARGTALIGLVHRVTPFGSTDHFGRPGRGAAGAVVLDVAIGGRG